MALHGVNLCFQPIEIRRSNFHTRIGIYYYLEGNITPPSSPEVSLEDSMGEGGERPVSEQEIWGTSRCRVSDKTFVTP